MKKQGIDDRGRLSCRTYWLQSHLVTNQKSSSSNWRSIKIILSTVKFSFLFRTESSASKTCRMSSIFNCFSCTVNAKLGFTEAHIILGSFITMEFTLNRMSGSWLRRDIRRSCADSRPSLIFIIPNTRTTKMILPSIKYKTILQKYKSVSEPLSDHETKGSHSHYLGQTGYKTTESACWVVLLPGKT